MKNGFKKTFLPFCSLFLIAILFSFIGCSETTTPSVTGPRSDLTRTGKFVSFTSNKDGNYDIFIAQVDANGNLATTGLVYPDNPHNLTGANNIFTDKQSNWSPNGRILVYSSKVSANGPQEIYAFFFKADGSLDPAIPLNPHIIVNPINTWLENPQFSPDGNYLVWDKREDNHAPFGTIDLDDTRDLWRGFINYNANGNIDSITQVTQLTATLNDDEFDPKWSPRNSVRRIAYTKKTSGTDFEIWIMDPLSSPPTSSVFYNANRNGYPAWSPECDRIYFETDHGNSGIFKIAYLSYPTFSGNPNDLVQSNTENLRYPTRVPNGNYLAYIRIDNLGNGSIYVTTTTSGGTGNKLLPLAFDAFDNLYPAW